jgi:hypothetical protein
MTRRLAPFLLLALLASTISFPGSAFARADRTTYRPDAWIKLCGLSTGCTINPLPHPWRGNDVYNRTGVHQRVAVRLDNGEGVRFWLTLQNDGATGDTFVVKGCAGNRYFVVNAVLVGLYKRPDWRARNITKGFKAGTAEFTFPASTEGKKVHLTLNIVSSDAAVGVSYRCPISLYSTSDPTAKDKVVATMSGY